MPETPRPLEHQDAEKKTDEALKQEAKGHLGDSPPLQIVAELLGKLRALDLPWWTPGVLRARWSATDRMRWYRARADLRQEITTQLSGLAPRAARKKTPEFQGALIDSAIDESDVTVRAFEDAFEPADLVVYGPADDFWHAFVERMPWGDDTPVHQELCAWLLDALLADQSSIDGLSRKPILTAWDARTAIDGRVWHTRMPLEIRVAIDEARLNKERHRPEEPFHAESDLSIAVSATIAASIPLKDLAPVFITAQRQMGFGGPRPRKAAEATRPNPAPSSPGAAPPPPLVHDATASAPKPFGAARTDGLVARARAAPAPGHERAACPGGLASSPWTRAAAGQAGADPDERPAARARSPRPRGAPRRLRRGGSHQPLGHPRQQPRTGDTRADLTGRRAQGDQVSEPASRATS